MARSSRERVQQALDAVLAAADPMTTLQAARSLREAAEDLEIAAVHDLRRTGITWTQIGALYGMTKQGAQQRFGTDVQPPAPRRRNRRPSQRDTASGRDAGSNGTTSTATLSGVLNTAGKLGG
jgi:hypothetical protein